MRTSLFHSAVLISLLFPGPAHAGVYSDDLTKCVVRATKEDDQVTFMRWMFGALATNPVLSDMVSVKPRQFDTLSKSTAALFERLIIFDCRTEFVAALKYEGGAAIESAFNTMGNVAARNLMTNPNTIAALGKLEQYRDQAALEALYKEAGIPFRAAAPAK